MGSASLLHYRPWRGPFHGAGHSVWPIARIALWMLFRRKLFWGLYALGLLIFFMFFFGQYMLAWAQGQMGEDTIRVAFIRTDPKRLIDLLRDFLQLNGSPETYRNFFWYQGYMVLILLALAGSVLVGNDFHFGSLPFYLAKPVSRWHYLLGKCLAVAVFVNLMTTVPALILFFQYGLLDPTAEHSWSYFVRERWLLGGIVGYGLLLALCLSLMMIAAATWLRRTVPLVMAWMTLFFFFRHLATALVDGLQYSRRWRLLDLWNDTYLVGNYFLGNHPVRHAQPEVYEAGLMLGLVTLLCLAYLSLRIRAVEIVK
jgi:ABC-type transport system involved in multi-copper enzyme maturation permease subunit